MKAFIVIDIQNDFLPAGALPVHRGDEIIPLANELQRRFDLIIATQDWHPANHASFAANHPGKKPGDRIDLHGIEQILWPAHCVQNTPGAEFAPALDTTRFARVFRKGTDPAIDSYSAFFDNAHRRATGLGEYLIGNAVSELYLCGLALDYCVKFSALDACEVGFKVRVVVDACRAIAPSAPDLEKSFNEMRAAGAILLNSSQV